MAKTLTIDEAIEGIVAEIAKLEIEIRDKKKTVNTLCAVNERDALYTLDEPEVVTATTRIRPDQFYGQPLASAVRVILEMRKQQGLGAAQINEIFELLVEGGYQFNTKNDEVARQSLRNSLSKNTVTFHKLPNGRFGLLNWYPNVKPSRASAGSASNGNAQGVEEEEETEEVTAEAVAKS